jgi:hypothetical protein
MIAATEKHIQSGLCVGWSSGFSLRKWTSPAVLVLGGWQETNKMQVKRPRLKAGPKHWFKIRPAVEIT